MREQPEPIRAPDEPPTTDPPLAPPPNPGQGGEPLPPRTLPGTEEAPVEAPDPGLPAPIRAPGTPD